MTKTKTAKKAASTSASAYYADPKDLVIIGLDTEHKSETEHPLYDPRIKLKLDEHMIANVMANGILEPVLCRKNGEALEVVAGRQRVRWARAANEKLAKQGAELVRVPYMLRRGDDATMYGIVISENEVRQGDDYLTQALKAQRLIAMGRSEEEVAVAFGVSKATIHGRLKLLEMAPSVQRAVQKGDIAIHEALAYAKLPHDKQDDAMVEIEAAKIQNRRPEKPAGAAKTHGDKATKTEILAVAKYLSGTAQMALLWAVGEIPEAAASEDKGFAKALAAARAAKIGGGK